MTFPPLTGSEELDAGWRLSGNPVSDTYAKIDKLGFEPYVDAVCAFLTDQFTAPPLTMSVEGEWGSGKSSFMRQLQRRLESDVPVMRGAKEPLQPERPKVAVRRSRNLTFWFNAWRHDKQDQMWAAFALFLTRELRERRNIFQRLWGDLLLAISRAKTPWAKVRLAAVVLLWTALIIGTVALVVYTLEQSGDQLKALVAKAIAMLPGAEKPKAAADGGAVVAWVRDHAVAHRWFAALLVCGVAWSWVHKHLGKRLEIRLEKYLDKPDYDKRTAFIESFHEDFSRMVRAYAGKDKIFVFVDDLDRCDVPRAAELMQAINLMIGDNPIIFIVGMDREKVAAGITLKFEKLLPYLRGAPESGMASARHPSSFGYSYLEKFIQITFRVPRTSEQGIEVFLDSLSQGGGETEDQKRERRRQRVERSARRQLVEVVAGADSSRVEALVRMVAPVLEWNPRRIKQFINTFRLQAYLASDLGLLDLVEGGPVPETEALPISPEFMQSPTVAEEMAPRLVLEQIGVFCGIAMTWPDLVMDLANYPWLLKRMYESMKMEGTSPSGDTNYSDDRVESELVARWRGERLLMSLLERTTECPEYSLRSADLRMLLNIFPREDRRSDRNVVEAATGPTPERADPWEQFTIRAEEGASDPLPQAAAAARGGTGETSSSFVSSFPGFSSRAKSPPTSGDGAKR